MYDLVRRTATPVTLQGAQFAGAPLSVRLSRDGRMLHYVQADTQSDIWLIELAPKR